MMKFTPVELDVLSRVLEQENKHLAESLTSLQNLKIKLNKNKCTALAFVLWRAKMRDVVAGLSAIRSIRDKLFDGAQK